MKVSIIIPVYHVEPYIVRCLQSVVVQEKSIDIELILVDDCGNDNSILLATDFLERCKGVDYRILYHTQNGGLSAARNTGLKAATGEYVYFLDSDDEITGDCISKLVAPLSKYQYDFVVGDYRTTLGGEESMLRFDEDEALGNAAVLESYAKGQWYVMAWNKLCRREFLLQNHLYFEEGVLHEDVVWSFKLACKAASMYVVKQSTYIYSIRESSIMTGMSIDKDMTVYTAAFDAISWFIKDEKRCYGKWEYMIFQGKRAGILYSLLQKDEIELYEKYYPLFYKQCCFSPWKAFRKRVISVGYFLRDLHYSLPLCLGRVYMRLFYLILYKFRGKKIEGAIWN